MQDAKDNILKIRCLRQDSKGKILKKICQMLKYKTKMLTENTKANG